MLKVCAGFQVFGYLWHHFQYNHTFDMSVLLLCISESSLVSPVSASSVMGGSDHESDDTIILSEDGSPSQTCQRSDDEAKNVRLYFILQFTCHQMDFLLQFSFYS